MIKLLKRLHWLHDWGEWHIPKGGLRTVRFRNCKQCNEFQIERYSIYPAGWTTTAYGCLAILTYKRKHQNRNLKFFGEK